MSFEVVWSLEAQRTYWHVLVDLSEKWADREVNAFIQRTEEVQSYLRKYPRMYAFSESQKAYRAVLHANVSLLYRIDDAKKE